MFVCECVHEIAVIPNIIYKKKFVYFCFSLYFCYIILKKSFSFCFNSNMKERAELVFKV